MKSTLRIIIFLISLILTIFYSIFPAALATKMGGGNIYLVMLALIGICFGFVYGIGYVPTSKFWRILINPLVILLLIIVPIVLLRFNN